MLTLLVRLLPAGSRIGLVRRTYEAVARTSDHGTLEALRRACLSKVFEGVQGGDDPIEIWQTRKYAFDRYISKFTVLSSSDAARIYGFIHLLDGLRQIPGDIVECGVGYGKSLTILVFGVSILKLERTVFGFDSFSGFPKASADDLGPRVDSVGVPPGGWTKTPPAFIGTILKTDQLRDDSILHEQPVTLKLVPGVFADTLPSYVPEKIAFLHVDCDLYESTCVVLEQCLSRMSPGGVVVLDEYQDPYWPGATKAADEMCAAHGLQLVWFPYVQRFGFQL